MVSPHFKGSQMLWTSLSLEPAVLQVSSLEKIGGDGKEWNIACLHECV